jgi:hypothetical protein
MKKSTIFFFSAMMLFLGIVIGFLASPAKNGVNICNRSKNHGFPHAKPFSAKGCCSSDDTEDDEY